MKILDAKNPQWVNDKSAINLEVNFAHLPEEYVSFTASPEDPEKHGRELYERALDGEFGEIIQSA